MLMCVDNGFKYTKVATASGTYRFASRIQKATALDKNVITYGIIDYQVGSGSDDLQADKTSSLISKLCLLRALAEQDADDFDLILDLPIGHYYNEDFRERFGENMGKSEEILYNGKKRNIRIRSAKVFPQGLAALYAGDINDYKDKAIGILDIGGLTIDGCVIDNLKPLKETIFSANFGTIILENRIKTALNSAFLLNVQDYEVPYLIHSGIDEIPESKAVIDAAVHEYFAALKREMIAKNWSIDTLEIVGTGGGSALLRDYLELHFHYTQTENPICGNVLGLYRIGDSL
jgi:hypothetical protein